jgi:DNA-binding response OmpR family regulator
MKSREVVMSLARRSAGELFNKCEPDVYDDGYLRVEHNGYYVACDRQTVRLPRTEFLILSRLARSAERIVSAEEIWEYAWRTEKPLNSDSLHVYIYRLRLHILPYGLRIENLVNVGYRLLVNVNERVDS